MKLRYRPTSWDAMPLSARKAFLRLRKHCPATGYVRGWEWFITFAEPGKVYAANRNMNWFVAEGASQMEIR